MLVSRWITRLLLIAVLVQMGLAITGAILGSIGGSLAELVVTRFYVRPRFRWRPAFPMRVILSYAVPLFVAGISMRLFDRLDLYALKILGGTTDQVGFYAAAQNLTLLTGILALSFTPVLLATLSQAIAAADVSLARTTAQEAMRIVIGLLPVAGMAAGAAPGIVGVVFGQAFLPAAPLFAVLVFGAQALLMVVVTTTILTAAGRPGWTSVLTAPVPALAAGGYVWFIPRLGAVGAAIVTTSCATLLAIATIVAVHRAWQIFPPLGTVWRSAATCVLAYGVAVMWTTPGWLILVKLTAIAVLIGGTYAALGEFRKAVPSPAS